MRKLSAAFMILFLLSSAPALCKSKNKDKKDKSSSNSSSESRNSSSSSSSQSTADEIMDAVEAEKPTEEEKTAQAKKQQDRVDHVIDAIADQAHMGEEEKTKLKAKIAEAKAKHESMPPELKAKIDEKIDASGFCKDTTEKVLSEHFDETDLKAILKFLKTPTGKKLIKSAPDMLAQTVELAAIKYVPTLLDAAKSFRMPAGMGPGMMPPGMMPQGFGGGMQNLSPEQQRQMMEKLRQMFQNGMPHLNQPTSPNRSKDDET